MGPPQPGGVLIEPLGEAGKWGVRRQVGEDRAEDRLYDVRLRGRLRGELVRLDDAAIEGIRRQPRIAQRLPPTFHLVFDVGAADRKSTRLNSSHLVISYAVFCLK